MPAPQQLVICIPTYNRAACLRRLLGVLERELQGLESDVGILVSDNASPDDTPQVVHEFASRMPNLAAVRHPENVGADENFCRCVERVTSEYFWIIGDDDLPRAGAIALLVRMLAAHSPDIVKLRAWGSERLVDDAAAPPLRRLDAVLADPVEFARRANVYLTFVSSIVLRRATFVAGADGAQLRRYVGTHLSQLSWVLGTMQQGVRLVDVTTICVLSQSVNSGGYGVLQVFGQNFPSILRQQFGPGSPVAEAAITRYAGEFLSNVIWMMRHGTAGAFEREDPRTALQPQLGRSAMFPLLMAVWAWPRPVAGALRLVCRAVGWSLRRLDHVRSRTRAIHIA